jgi:hypothetical protein
MKALKLYLALALIVINIAIFFPSKSFGVEVTFSGDFRTRWWFLDLDFNRNNDNTLTVFDLRFQSIMTAKASDNVKAVLFLRTNDNGVAGSSGDFGEFPGFGNLGAQEVGAGGTIIDSNGHPVIGGNWKGRGFGGDQVNVITQEAYVDVRIPQISPHLSVIAGVPGFDLGPNHLVVAFVDAPGTKIRIDVPDKFDGYFFTMKLQEGGLGTDFDADAYGFNASIPVNPNLTIGGYVIYELNKSGINGSATFDGFATAIGKSGDAHVGGPPAADGGFGPSPKGDPRFTTFPNGLPGTVLDPNFFGFYGGDKVTTTWFDLNAVGKSGGFNYIAEGVVSTGKIKDRFRGDVDLRGFALDGTVSYNLTAAKANVGAKFTYASGDDPKTRDKNEEHQVINSDYIYSRLFFDNSVNGFTGHGNPANSIVFKLFASAEPFAGTPLRLGVEYLNIRAVEDHFFGTQTIFGGPRFFDGTEDKSIGNEVDFYFTYRINDNTVFNGEFDFMVPGEYVTGKSGVFLDPLTGQFVDNTAAGDDTAIKGGISIYYTF